MKICFFSGDISRTGGTERVALLIANELARRKYDVNILSMENGISTSFECDRHISLSSLHMEKVKGGIGRKIIPFIRLLVYLKKEKPDILINIDVILCLYSIPLKLFIKTKMVAWEHFNFRSNNGVKNRYRARKLAARFADEIIVLTQADLKEYQKKLNIRHFIDCIYNPSVGDVPNINFAQRENLVIASGRLTYQKNFLELLKIWRRVEAKHPNWKLIICGSGQDEAELKDFALNNNLKNVIFEGFVRNITEYYKKSKIMVLTSRFEGFPMVLLEGQKAGLPIVSYDCFTGPSEIIINGVDGYLIRQGDQNDFVSKLEMLMTDENLLKAFSRQAQMDSERFDLYKIVDNWESAVINR